MLGTLCGLVSKLRIVCTHPTDVRVHVRGNEDVECGWSDFRLKYMAWTPGGFEGSAVLAEGSESELYRPCTTCGVWTGNFCETPLQQGKGLWQGGVCLAAVHIPTERWAPGQRTPLCSKCEARDGACRYCLRISGCTPFMKRT